MPKLTKISDNRFNGNHPNNINVGYSVKCSYNARPVVGECFVTFGFSSMRTSMVTEILETTDTYIKFNTLNSTYLLEL